MEPEKKQASEAHCDDVSVHPTCSEQCIACHDASLQIKSYVIIPFAFKLIESHTRDRNMEEGRVSHTNPRSPQLAINGNKKHLQNVARHMCVNFTCAICYEKYFCCRQVRRELKRVSRVLCELL